MADMKKIVAPLIACLMLCSCSAQHADYAPGNTGNTIVPPIMSSGSGYYYNDRTDHKMSLKYYDTATGQSIYLCARPECLHDGNEFCNATSEKYSLLGMSMYEDELYLEVLEWDYEKTERSFRLLRASKDGTGLSAVCTFRRYTVAPDSGALVLGTANPVIHRGKAYLSYCTDVGDNNLFGIAQVDISTGASKIIFEQEQSAPVLTAYENTVCFPVYKEYGSYSISEYDISAGRLTESAVPVYPQSVAAAENGWYYIGIEGAVRLYFFDSDTKESTELDNELSEFISEGSSAELKYDGSCYYAMRYDHFDSVLDDVNTYTVGIFSEDLRKLGEVQIEGTSDWRVRGALSLDILDGDVYVQRYSDVVCCPVEDIINGNVHWETALVFDRAVELLSSDNSGGER